MKIENLYELRANYEKELALAEAKVAVVNDIIAMELSDADTATAVEADVEVDENAETATNIFSATTY